MATSTRNEHLIFENFNTTEATSAGQRWQKYLLRFENMMDAYQIEDDKRKKALLIHHAGEQVFNIFCTFENCKNLTYEQTSKQIFDYFNPKKCIEYEIHKFRKCFQKETENIDEFHTRLLTLAENCEFANKDLEIKMQIIQKCKSDKLRKKALQQSMTLKDILSLERSMEISAIQAAEMSNKNEQTYKITKTIHNKSLNDDKKCFRCGKSWPHEKHCPAMGKTCTICNKMYHFSSVCRSRKPTINSTTDLNEDANIESDEESI